MFNNYFEWTFLTFLFVILPYDHRFSRTAFFLIVSFRHQSHCRVDPRYIISHGYDSSITVLFFFACPPRSFRVYTPKAGARTTGRETLFNRLSRSRLAADFCLATHSGVRVPVPRAARGIHSCRQPPGPPRAIETRGGPEARRRRGLKCAHRVCANVGGGVGAETRHSN